MDAHRPDSSSSGCVGSQNTDVYTSTYFMAYYDYISNYSGFYQPSSFMADQIPQLHMDSMDQNAFGTCKPMDSPCSTTNFTNSHPVQSPTSFIGETSPVSNPISSKMSSLPGPKICSVCSTTKTCRWRKNQSKMECNACYIYRQKYKKNRPSYVFRN